MRILVDAMGGDHAPDAPAQGALAAGRDGRSVALVGRSEEVLDSLRRAGARDNEVTVIEAPDVVEMHDSSPAEAARSSPGASISVCMETMRHGDGDAVVTMGHTGAGLAAAMLRLGRLPGVRRPALAVPFPTLSGPCLLIDIGANVDVKAEYLAQFAVMGAAYAQGVLGVASPRVGLLSIGEEAGKGSEVVQEAYALLAASDLNFVGNIEGRDIPAGAADVAVMDGFTGNVLIKFAEGIGSLVERITSDAARADPLGMLGGLLLRPSLRRARKRMDYRAYGGAVLLGVKGLVVIGHGRSDGAAVRTAIEVAARGVESDVVGAIARGTADGRRVAA